MRSQELTIFRKFCKPLRNFVTKYVPVMFIISANNGDLQGGFDFLTHDFAAYRTDSLTSQ